MRDVFTVLPLRILADRCGVSVQAAWKWKKKGKVPAERVLLVERATGVPRYEIRPDLYGLEPLPPQQVAGAMRRGQME